MILTLWEKYVKASTTYSWCYATSNSVSDDQLTYDVGAVLNEIGDNLREAIKAVGTNQDFFFLTKLMRERISLQSRYILGVQSNSLDIASRKQAYDVINENIRDYLRGL